MLSGFALLLTVPALAGPAAAQAQEPGLSIDVQVQLCEAIVNGTAVDCTSIRFDEPQPTLNVLVNGEPYAGSRVPLVETSVGFRATLDVPQDSTLTISVASDIPDSYAPAVGYDPLVIAAADVPQGGCGGENACPVIDMALVRSDGAIAGTTALRILARNCAEPLTGSIFEQQESCVPATGAFFNVYAESGAFLGNCEAAIDTSGSGATFPIFTECRSDACASTTSVRYAPTRTPWIDRPSRVCTTTVQAVTDLSQLTCPDSGAGHDVPCRREDDDLPDESI